LVRAVVADDDIAVAWLSETPIDWFVRRTLGASAS
jgi:hypothetical protein